MNQYFHKLPEYYLIIIYRKDNMMLLVISFRLKSHKNILIFKTYAIYLFAFATIIKQSPAICRLIL